MSLPDDSDYNLGPSASQLSVSTASRESAASSTTTTIENNLNNNHEQQQHQTEDRSSNHLYRLDPMNNSLHSPANLMNHSFHGSFTDSTSAYVGGDASLGLHVPAGTALTLVGSAPIVVTDAFPGTRPPLETTAQGLRDKWKTGVDSSGLLNRSLQEPNPRIQELSSRPSSPYKSLHSSFINLQSSPETDSGISNTYANGHTSRYRNSYAAPRAYTPEPRDPREYREPPNLSASFSHAVSPRDYCEYGKSPRYSKSVVSLDSAYNGSGSGHRDVQRALQESENRRHLLVEKLRDAKTTIQPCPACLAYTHNDQHQAEKLNLTECTSKELSFSLDEARAKEMEYRRKMANLEKDRESLHNIRLDSVKLKEEMLAKVTALDAELKSLRTSYNLLEADSRRKQEIVDQTCIALSRMEEDSNSLIKGKENLQKEVQALKESLRIARNHNEWAETHGIDQKSELEKLRRENADLHAENKSLMRQISELKDANHNLKEEIASFKSHRNSNSEERHRMTRQLESFQEAMADMKATLASTSADKERFFQEKLDLHQQLQKMAYDMDSLHKVKAMLEDQLTETNEELSRTCHETQRRNMDDRKQDDELSAVKKVSEVLSIELSSTKTKLEQSLEQNNSLEHAKKLAFQQHALYEQEIKSLEQQINNMRKSVECEREDFHKDRSSQDDQISRVREELRQVKEERNSLESKAHSLETRQAQQQHGFHDQSVSLQRDMHTWKANAEKLTANLSRKELEIESISKLMQDLKEENSFLKANNDTYQKQQGDLIDNREELIRVQDENRRMVQERAENQQVIQLLEMQKSILAKASDGILSKSQDAEVLQSQLEQCTAENNLLKEKVDHLETVKEDLTKRHQEDMRSSHDAATLRHSTDDMTHEVEDLRTENEQLQEVAHNAAQKLTEMEKEFAAFRSRYSDTVPRVEYRRLDNEKSGVMAECERVKTQYETLEQIHHRMLTEKEELVNEGKHPTVAALQKERNGLDTQVGLLSSQLQSVEAEKKKSDNEVAKLESLVSNLQRQVFASSHKDSSDVTSYQRQVNHLQSELEDARKIQQKQETLINSLKDELEDENTKKPYKIRQSLDDVGEELNNMRSELHKLMAVIQMKDQEIENLEQQLRSTKSQVVQRDNKIENIRNGEATMPHNGGIVHEKLASLEQEKVGMNSTVLDLRKQNKELGQKVSNLQDDLTRARVMQAGEAGSGEVNKLLDEERHKWQEKMKRELAAKDRQIESLEEQLRHTTSLEIKKMKRDAGKVDLLKQENRRLQNQLKPSSSKWLQRKDEPAAFQPDENSYDSSDGVGCVSPSEHTMQGNLAQELAGIEGAPGKGRLGKQSSEETLTDHDDPAGDSKPAANDKAQSKNETNGNSEETDSGGSSSLRSKRPKRSFSADPELKESLKLNLRDSMDDSEQKDSNTDKEKNSGGVKIVRSSSLADLTAPRPWRSRQSLDEDDDSDFKERPSLKTRLAEAEKKYEDDKFAKDLTEKIRSRRKLLNTDFSDDTADSRRSMFEKSDSDSDRSSSAYARRRSLLLNSSPSDTGRTSITGSKYRKFPDPKASLGSPRSSRFSSKYK